MRSTLSAASESAGNNGEPKPENADESAPRASGPPTDRPAESGRPEESRAAFSRAGTESGRGNEPTPADESGTDTPGSVS